MEAGMTAPAMYADKIYRDEDGNIIDTRTEREKKAEERSARICELFLKNCRIMSDATVATVITYTAKQMGMSRYGIIVVLTRAGFYKPTPRTRVCDILRSREEEP